MESSRWSRWVTITAVLLLAGIAAVVSYSHMYELALRHGEPEWRAALFPLSVDGMIVGASMTLLSDARHGRKGGLLPWTLLIVGSGASLAANVAVADPTMWSRIIHAWPSFALIGAYELLMREFRTAARSVRTASADDGQAPEPAPEAKASQVQHPITSDASKTTDFQVVHGRDAGAIAESTLSPFQDRAWRWALDRQRETGELPSGKEIAARFDRKERWGRLVKQQGQRQGARTDFAESSPRNSRTGSLLMDA
ncbi:DUF2637 domain-containing protein [Nocardiopsis deserti]|uniref:DUF2637 domain-containing protein n=1 Tax=Nocardiopsis deserti TaxID=2605988 RepID=UPI00123A402A|nr:DUF2637 domain-containing protein [Nocardiopsis deserti]